MPKVSIIIPIYNVEMYLRECLDSVVNQTLKDIEIICIDDGSTDNSLSILKEYAQKDYRIRILEQENKFAGVARNNGLKVAQGEYIGFVDADDVIDESFYEALYNVAKENDTDIVKGNFNICYPDGSVVNTEENDRIRKEISMSQIKIPYNGFCTSWWSAIYKKQLIDEYNIEFAPIKYLEDVPFLYKSIAVAKSFEIINDVYYHYLVHEQSTSHKELTRQELLTKYDDYFKSRENVLEFLNKVDLPQDKYLKLFDSKVYGGSIGRFKEICRENKLEDYNDYVKRIAQMIDNCKYDFYKYKNNNKGLHYLKHNNYGAYIKNINGEQVSLWQKIFSVKNSSQNTHKVIRLFNIKIKLRKKENKCQK